MSDVLDKYHLKIVEIIKRAGKGGMSFDQIVTKSQFSRATCTTKLKKLQERQAVVHDVFSRKYKAADSPSSMLLNDLYACILSSDFVSMGRAGGLVIKRDSDAPNIFETIFENISEEVESQIIYSQFNILAALSKQWRDYKVRRLDETKRQIFEEYEYSLWQYFLERDRELDEEFSREHLSTQTFIESLEKYSTGPKRDLVLAIADIYRALLKEDPNKFASLPEVVKFLNSNLPEEYLVKRKKIRADFVEKKRRDNSAKIRSEREEEEKYLKPIILSGGMDFVNNMFENPSRETKRVQELLKTLQDAEKREVFESVVRMPKTYFVMPINNVAGDHFSEMFLQLTREIERSPNSAASTSS